MKRYLITNLNLFNVKISFLTVALLMGIFTSPAQKFGITDGSSFTPATLVQIHLNNTYGDILQLTNSLTGRNASHGLIFSTIDSSGIFNIAIDNVENGYLAFSTNNLQRLMIAANGNVGIGIGDPAKKLTVIGSSFFGTEYFPIPMDIEQFVYKQKTGVISSEILSTISLTDLTPTANVNKKVHGSLTNAWLNSNFDYSDVAGFTSGIDHNGDGTITELSGLKAEISEQAAGNLVNVYGILSRGGLTANGSISNYHLFFSSNPYKFGSGTVNKLSGLTIENLDAATNNTHILIGTNIIPSGNFSIYSNSVYPSYYKGNMGIGLTNPQNRLHVFDSIDPLRIEGLRLSTKDTFLVISGNGVVSKRTISSSSGWSLAGNNLSGTEFLGSLNSQPLKFYTNNTERMKINSAGDVSVGSITNRGNMSVFGKILVADTVSPFPFDMQLAVYKVQKGVITDEPFAQAAVISAYPSANVTTTVHGSASLVMLNSDHNYSQIEAMYNGVHLYGNGNVNEIVGIKSDITHASAGSITDAYGFMSVLHIDNSGGVSNYHGFLIQGLEKTGTGVPVRISGLTIPVQSPEATNNTAILLGTRSIPNGNYSIFDSSNRKSFFSGKIGIGTTNPTQNLTVFGSSVIGNDTMTLPFEYQQFVYRHKSGNISTDQFSQLSLNSLSPTADVTNQVHGSLTYTWLNNNFNYADIDAFTSGIDHNGSGNVSQITAVKAEVNSRGTGTISTAYGVQCSAEIYSSGTISNFHGICIMNPYNPAGTVANVSGLTIEGFTTGTNRTSILIGTKNIPNGNFSLYNQSNAPTYFRGQLGVGTTNPLNALHVSSPSDPVRFDGLQQAAKDTALVVSGNGIVSKRAIADFSWTLHGNNLSGSEFIGSTDSQAVLIYSNNHERIRVEGDGKTGIKTAAPNSTLHVNGSFALPVKTVTAGYLADAADYTILCNAVSMTLSLPAANGIAGRIYNIKKINASVGTITIQANAAELIDGSNTNTYINSQYQSITIQSDGTNWVIISKL